MADAHPEENGISPVENIHTTDSKNSNNYTQSSLTGYLKNQELSMKNDSILLLDQEKRMHRQRTGSRLERHYNILMNFDNRRSSYTGLLFILITLVLATVSTTPYTLIPAHNVFYHPDKWYESPLQMIVTSAWIGIHLTLASGYYLNIDNLKRIRPIAYMSSLMLVTLFLVYMISYIGWTKAMGHQFPIPLIGLIMTLALFFAGLTAIWFLFPSTWRSNKTFRKRLKFCIAIWSLGKLVIVPYKIMEKLLVRFQGKYQPVVSILMPVIREFNIWLCNILIGHSADGDVAGARLIGSFDIANRHGVMLCYFIASLASTTTSYVLVGVDTCINIGLCARTIWLKKQRPLEGETWLLLLQEIAMNEINEFVTPLAYLLSFLMAYYGPNASLLGNVGNSYWSYQAVEDIDQTITMIFLFFFIEFCGTVASGILLKLTCNINLLAIISDVAHEFGPIICVIVSVHVSIVSISDDTNVKGTISKTVEIKGRNIIHTSKI